MRSLPQRTSIATVIDKERIEESPVQSRNFLNFILLAPGVSASNAASSQSTPSLSGSGFSFGGLRPRSNAIFIDGASNNDEFTGSNRTEISLEDVQEFQVVNHGFAAESCASRHVNDRIDGRPSNTSASTCDTFSAVPNCSGAAALPRAGSRYNTTAAH